MTAPVPVPAAAAATNEAAARSNLDVVDRTANAVSLVVDDERHAALPGPGTTLAELLRDELDLTSTKIGCEMGNCGACTVLLDGTPVYSCLVLAAECGNAVVETAAGLDHGRNDRVADSGLGSVHRAFAEHDALQCGFCTPGQIVSVESLRRRASTGEEFDDDAIRHALAGNLCRCGAYQNILAAARSVVGESARESVVEVTVA